MKIYCDGSAYPNPGPGGFGVIVVDNHENFVYNIYRERCENTTNNREELKAVLYCLKNYGINIYEATTLDSFLFNFPIVFSDSAYAVNTFNQWMFQWANNDWKNSSGKIAENVDIVKEYYELYKQGYRIQLEKIKGHSGVKWNEVADRLASADGDKEHDKWKEKIITVSTT